MIKSCAIKVYQNELKITLDGSKPPIWGCIQVNSSIKLGELHSYYSRYDEKIAYTLEKHSRGPIFIQLNNICKLMTQILQKVIQYTVKNI